MVHRFAAGLAANAGGDVIALLPRFLALKTTNGDARLRSVYMSSLTSGGRITFSKNVNGVTAGAFPFPDLAVSLM